MIFMDPGEMGIIPQLMLTTASWKKSRAQGTCNCGLRQALMGTLLMEASARIIKAKLLSTEPLGGCAT